jgi:ribonuclease-3
MTLNLSRLKESSDLYKEAFIHKSLSQDMNFERLEFLGDSLLGSKVTELLFKTYPKTSEGDLSRWRSALVSQESLAQICDRLELSTHLEAKRSEIEALIRNERIKASLLEAFLGAYYLNEGREAYEELVEELFSELIKEASDVFQKQDPKTLFQEKAQKKFKATPVYETTERTGPSHAPSFKVSVNLNSEKYEEGSGKSVKEAQRDAASRALKKMTQGDSR